MRIQIIAAPESLITLERARLQCKVDEPERDPELTDAIDAARAWVEEYLGVPVGERQLRLTFKAWAGSALLPFDVSEILSVTAAGAPVASEAYELDGRTLYVPGAAPVVVELKTGYTSATLPAPVRSAMLLLLADLVAHKQRQSKTQLYDNSAFLEMLWPYRERGFV